MDKRTERGEKTDAGAIARTTAGAGAKDQTGEGEADCLLLGDTPFIPVLSLDRESIPCS